MSLSAPGIGSGLDVDSLVSQLVALERRPLERLVAKKDDVQVQISATGQLRGAISRFQSAARALADRETLGGLEASSSDADVATVTAGVTADGQSHDIVVTHLATRHRTSLAPVADENTALGTGTLDITVDGSTLSLTLADGNNTLAQVRDAINADADNPGVTATIITVDAGARLILTSNDTGLANAMTVTPGGGLAGLAVSEVDEAKDALVSVDGFTVNSASNTLSDVIPGVSVALKGAGTTRLDFASDPSRVTAAARELVESYNSLRGTVKLLGRTSMQGDSMLLGLERSVNARLGNPVTLPDGGGQVSLFEAGVSFGDDGDLHFDGAKLATAMTADPDRIFDLFGADGVGLGVTVGGFLDGFLRSDGALDGRVQGLRSRDRDLDQRIENAEFRLGRTEERLRAQFTSLDTLLGQLQVTSNYLSQQLLNLPSANNGNGNGNG